MDKARLRIEVEVNPTEDSEKVRKAVENIFGAVQLETKPLHRGSLLVARAEGAEAFTKFYNLLRRERIRDAARAVLFKGLKGNRVTFYLNKQAAFSGHISFSEATGESPLGPIKTEIECDDPKELIDWLTPKTA